MSKMKFLGPLKAEKIAKPKWGVFSETPCMWVIGSFQYHRLDIAIEISAAKGDYSSDYPLPITQPNQSIL